MNQKRRTRAAIVDAARAILDRGETPTVSQVADEALMTRTTVYRYFPTQESLLLELSVSASVDEIEELLARPPDGSAPRDRVIELVEAFNHYIAENETLSRTAQRHYLDTWLAAERSGDGHDAQMREGRRLHWLSAILEPVGDEVPDAERKRLEAALCLTMGGETHVVLRDVCHLDADEAAAVARWAAEALLAAAGL